MIRLSVRVFLKLLTSLLNAAAALWLLESSPHTSTAYVLFLPIARSNVSVMTATYDLYSNESLNVSLQTNQTYLQE